jgi:hypothetical protein
MKKILWVIATTALLSNANFAQNATVTEDFK